MKKVYKSLWGLTDLNLIPRSRYGGYNTALYPEKTLDEKYVDTGKPYYGTYYFTTQEKMQSFYDSLQKTEEQKKSNNQEVTKMNNVAAVPNNRYKVEELKAIFNHEFVEEFEALCDKYDYSDAYVWNKIWAAEYHNDNLQDCATWLRDSGYSALAKNEDFLATLCLRYEHEEDANYGTWDNIENAFRWLEQSGDWDEEIKNAYEEDDEDEEN